MIRSHLEVGWEVRGEELEAGVKAILIEWQAVRGRWAGISGGFSQGGLVLFICFYYRGTRACVDVDGKDLVSRRLKGDRERLRSPCPWEEEGRNKKRGWDQVETYLEFWLGSWEHFLHDGFSLPYKARVGVNYWESKGTKMGWRRSDDGRRWRWSKITELLVRNYAQQDYENLRSLPHFMMLHF